MEIRARPTSFAAMPQRAIQAISSRMRRKDHFSIFSFSLADLGGENDRGTLRRVSPCLEQFLISPAAVASSLAMGARRQTHPTWDAGLIRSDLEVTIAMENAPGDASNLLASATPA
jgi:hypothetical protein